MTDTYTIPGPKVTVGNEDYNAYMLAGMADVVSLDTLESPGAQFLLSVADTVEDYRSNDSLDEDSACEIADSSVPIYTYDIWQTFVDLAAYQEDPSELGYDASDMTKAAQVSLYMIAERLVNELIEAIADEDTDEEE